MADRLTREHVRAIALALPEAHPRQHRSRPDLRVRNRIFATPPPDGGSVNIKMSSVCSDL